MKIFARTTRTHNEEVHKVLVYFLVVSACCSRKNFHNVLLFLPRTFSLQVDTVVLGFNLAPICSVGLCLTAVVSP